MANAQREVDVEDNKDLKQAIAVHDRFNALAREMLTEGIDPGVIGHALIIEGSDRLLKSHGRIHAIEGLLSCFAEIRAAVIRDAANPPAATQ